MNFWYIYVCVSALFILFSFFCKEIHVKYLTHIYIIFLWCISAFRYMIGTDYYAYCNIWQSWNSGWEFDFFSEHEPVFNIILQTLQYFDFGVQSLFVVYTTFTMIFLYKGIKAYLANEIEILLAWFCFGVCFDGLWFSMNGIRQALSMAILLYATSFAIERKSIKFTGWYILACLCHYSSIIFGILYFIPKKKIKIKNIAFLFVVSAIISVTGVADKIIESIILLMIGDNDILGKYLAYIGVNSRILFAAYYNAVIVIIYALMIKNDCDKKKNYLLNVTILYIILFFVFNMGELIRIRQGVALQYILMNASLVYIVMKKYKNYACACLLIVMLCVNFVYRVSSYEKDYRMTPSDGNIDYELNFDVFR